MAAPANSSIANGISTVFTGTGTGTATAPTVAGNTTVVLTNTSSFIGTVFLETSLDGGLTWPTPATPLTTGTMVAGPLTFIVTTPQLTGGSYQTAQHRLRCSAYTSGTLTATLVEATVPAQTGSTGILGAPTSTGSVIGSFSGILGTTTSDSAPAGEIGEYLAQSMTAVSATGTTATMVGDSVSTVITATAHGLSAGQAVYFTNSGGGIGTGFVVNTTYYVTANSVTANTFSVSDTLAHAMAGTNAIAASTAGTGTQTVHQGAFLSTTVAADICGLALQPGDYDVDAIVFPGYGASTSVTSWALWIAPVGGSAQPTTAANVLAQGLTSSPVATANTTNTAAAWVTAGTVRVSLSAAGYLALGVQATFTVSTLVPQALLRARRVR